MDKISELKEIIVGLKMQLVRASIPNGNCPYAYYTPSTRQSAECGDSCTRCKRDFMVEIEKDIRKEVESI